MLILIKKGSDPANGTKLNNSRVKHWSKQAHSW